MRIIIRGYKNQGVKTLSRILSRAGTMAGFYANDFSEAGKSIVTGYVRFGKDSLIEKGPISKPDLLIIMDSSLFSIKEASGDTEIIVNSSKSLSKQKNIHNLDANEIAFKNTGKSYPNTALAGAAVKYLQKIQIKQVKQSIEQELKYKPAENSLAADEGLKSVK